MKDRDRPDLEWIFWRTLLTDWGITVLVLVALYLLFRFGA